MSGSIRKVFAILCAVCLAAIACGLMSPGSWERLEEIDYEDRMRATLDAADRLGEDPPETLPTLRAGYPTPTLRPTRTKRASIEESPQDVPKIKPGTCAWVRLPESDSYPEGEIAGVTVSRWRSDTSIATAFPHGTSGCEGEVFRTYHEWVLEEIFYMETTYTLYVVFAWENEGSNCGSLVKAGGITSMISNHFGFSAEQSDITVRVDPKGHIFQSYTFTPPLAAIGDRMTITQYAASGSFARNIRWHYEYTCD